MEKYWTTNKNGKDVWVTRDKAIDLVNQGKKQPNDFTDDYGNIVNVTKSSDTSSPYKTFKIYDKDNKPHDISAVDESDAYRQAIASGIRPRAATSAERERLTNIQTKDVGIVTKLAPENTKSILETGDWSIKNAAKDAMSLPQRLVGGAFGGDVGKTSSEYADEGEFIKSVATSPLILPNILAGLGSAGMSIPAQMAIQGGVGVGSGYLFDEGYGGKDVAIDVGLSAIPAIGPYLSKLPINASVKSITSALAKIGITGDASKPIVDAIQAGSYKDAERMATDLISSGSTKLASDIMPDVNTLRDGSYELAKQNILASAGSKPPRKLWDLPSQSNADVPMRSIGETTQALSTLDKAKSEVGLLDNLFREGNISKKAYVNQFAKIIETYADTPEILDELIMSSSSGFNDEIINLSKKLLADTEPVYDLGKYVTEGLSNPSSKQGAEELLLGTKLRKLQAPTTSPLKGLSVGDIGIGAGKKVLQKLVTQPGPTTSRVLSAGLNKLPSLVSIPAQVAYEGDKPEYAPRGVVSYEDLGMDADWQKEQAKKKGFK